MKETRMVLPNAVMLGSVKELLQEGKSVIIMTKGCSMSPFIRGERDSVELVKADTLSVGDIALAEITPGNYVLHRVIALDGDRVCLQGDGNLRGTESCRAVHVCGIVRTILRGGGRKVDCRSAAFVRCSRQWRKAPYQLRRICLAIYRRVKFL